MMRSQFLSDVEEGVKARLTTLTQDLDPRVRAAILAPAGRLMRSRLADRLQEGGVAGRPAGELVGVCVGTEILHAATLYHDDVIDASPRRRHKPSLWVETSIGGAILFGDVLLTEAVQAIHEAAPVLVPRFLTVMKEMALAELQVEVGARGKVLSSAEWIAHNRSKTGALFAFIAAACGGGETPLTRVLEEAGYRIGGAYQMLDDVLDVWGDEMETGKPTGLDQARGLLTPAQMDAERSLDQVMTEWAALCDDLAPWPAAKEAVESYFSEDVMIPFSRALRGTRLAKSLDGRVATSSLAG